MANQRGFTSDRLREIFKAGLRQSWTPERNRRSGHAYLYCPHPGCFYREAFSLSGKGKPHEVAAKLNTMRRHGFVWQGRGGKHIETEQTKERQDND